MIRFRPLALRLACRYASGAYAREDLEQVAYLGLVKALQRFDPERGLSFSTFAVPTIVGELRHHCRDTAWVAHVPRAMQESARDLRAASDELAARVGRIPTVAELAGTLGWSEERTVEVLLAAQSRASVPLDKLGSEDDEHLPAIGERLGAVDPGYDVVEELAMLDRALPALSAVEREVLQLHFAAGLKHREIAGRLGISEGRAARTLDSALATLRRIVGDTECGDGQRAPALAFAA